EARIARAAHLLIGTSAPVVDHLRALSSTPTLLLENGAEFERFAAATDLPPEYRDIPAPRAAYVGALAGRFDAGLVVALAANPGIRVVLIGPVSATIAGALASRRNVHFIGPRPYESVPAYLQHAQIGLLPLTSHPA